MTGSLLKVLDLGDAAPPGAVVAVQHIDDREISAGGVCGSDKVLVTKATAFDLASVTKVVGTMCALHRLAVLGKLTLNDPVSTYLPWTPCDPRTTLASLAYHRAGLWEWQPLYLADDDPRSTLDRLQLRYGFDEARHYSDLGFMLLGEVVSAVTGSPLDQAVAELVTDPLHLVNTRFGPITETVAAGGRGDQIERQMVATGRPYPILFANPDFVWRQAETIREANDGNCFHCFNGVSGHAGLFSTASDLLTLGMSLSRADPGMWGTHIAWEVFSEGPDRGQALGWRSMPVMFRGIDCHLIWHSGFTGCAMGFIPGHQFAVVMMTNRLLARTPILTTHLWAATLRAVDGLDNVPDPERMTT